MTVLVTGGLGFIGSKVVLQLLKKDIDVLVTDLDIVKNKIKILRSFEHHIKKNGRYFISYINVDDHRTAKNLCSEIKLNKLDCLIKTS